ncbi:MAG: reverse transcriptase-like protein [Deltaproteobacteria bacterium]|nr:reverse transcriptase-like protein [Deltaproteobacteria bacterium]
MASERATYCCVDIECTGQVPAYHDMISLGAVGVRPVPGGGRELGGSFYVEIQPVFGHVDPGAMAVHGLTIDHLRAHGRPRRLALEALSAWVAAETVPGTKPVFVGHNAPFDWSFVSHAYGVEGLPNPFGYKAMCTKSLAAGVLGLHWFDTNKEVLAERLALPPEDRAKKHRADYDAHYQALILLGLLAVQDRVARTTAPEGGVGSSGTRNASQAARARAEAASLLEGLSSDTWVVFTDGACLGNPGPSAAAAVLRGPGGVRLETARFLGRGTSQRAELAALRLGLALLDEAQVPAQAPVLLCTDSRYAEGMAVLGWKVRANADLVGPLRVALAGRPAARVRWVAGHAGIEGNERVDALAQAEVRRGG